MICSKCGSALPSNAKYCPECGKIVEVVPKCTNGHKMQPGQKFCCECGAPVKSECNNIQPKSNSSNSDAMSSQPSNGGKIIVKVIATVVVLGIACTVITAIGGVPSYIIGGICFVIIPNLWKFIDDN